MLQSCQTNEGGELLGGIVNSEFDSTLARRLDERCFPPVPPLNQIVIKFGIGRSTTSETGPYFWYYTN